MPGFPDLHHLPEFAQIHVLWVNDAIQPSYALPASSPPALKSFPASGFFPMSQLFASGGQSIGASASASVLPMMIQGWFPVGLTGYLAQNAPRALPQYDSLVQCSRMYHGKRESLWVFLEGHLWTLEAKQKDREIEGYSDLESPSMSLQWKKLKSLICALFSLDLGCWTLQFQKKWTEWHCPSPAGVNIVLWRGGLLSPPSTSSVWPSPGTWKSSITAPPVWLGYLTCPPNPWINPFS